jgi:hypothetical protein
MKTLILTNEQFNSAENQNRDKAIIGYRSIENGTKPLNIPRVSGSLPVDNDITIFADYITKYFEWYRNDDLYKNKNTGEILPQSIIYEKWKGNER